MKKLILFVICILITNVVMAQTVRFHFYADGATNYSSNIKLDGNLITLTKDGAYYMLYDSTATINNINSINGEIFTLNKNGKALTSGAEWYAVDQNGKKHYYAQNKSYTAGSIVKELGLGNSDLVIVDLYANWDMVDESTQSEDTKTDSGKDTKVTTSKKVRFHFYADGATGYSDNIYLDGNLICLKDGTYYMLYERTATINYINSINGVVFSLNKNGKALTSGAEWYSFDENGKKHYYSQNRSYKVDDIVKDLGLGNSDLVIVDVYPNWGKVEDGSQVKEKENPNFKLKRKEYRLKVNESTTLNLEKGTNLGLTWTSNNKSVATVDNNGVVKAKGVGRARITVADKYNNKSSCDIEVVDNSTHVVKIIYDMNGGNLDTQHGSTITNSGNTIKCKGDKYCQKIIYKSTTPDAGLLDYNNKNSINLIKKGFLIQYADEAWNTKKDGSGKTYSQSIIYKASDFCDASKKIAK